MGLWIRLQTMDYISVIPMMQHILLQTSKEFIGKKYVLNDSVQLLSYKLLDIS